MNPRCCIRVKYYVYRSHEKDSNASSFWGHVHFLQNTLVPADCRGNFETIDISTTSLGQRYFIMRGQRYLVNDKELQRASLKVGTSYIDFYQVLACPEALSNAYFLCLLSFIVI